MKPLIQAWTLLRMRGPGFLFYILSGYLYPKWALATFSRFPPNRLKRIAAILAAALGALVFIGTGFWLGWGKTAISALILLSIAYLAWKLSGVVSLYRLFSRARELQHRANGGPFTHWVDWPVPAGVKAAVQRKLDAMPGSEIALGEIDNDGRLWSAFGELPGWKSVSKDAFVRRKRFPLTLVLVDGAVLVKKQFGRDRFRFAREWHNLALLSPRANVPAVFRADEKNNVLYKNMVVGRTIRDVLVEAGAKILNVQTDSDPALSHLSGEPRLHAILERGHDHLKQRLPDSFFKKLEAQMDAVHRCGVTNLSLTFGNVMVDSQGEPWLIDMESTSPELQRKSPLFLWLRDQDRQKFNLVYNQEILTEATAIQKLERQKKKLGGWYAPVDFGGGLTIGGFWTIESGTGRWEYLNAEVVSPLVKGKRVLDLGTNNGVLPMMMLRAGASEVVGLELEKSYVESAHLVKAVFEWRDMCTYPLSLCTANMLDILGSDFGQFDVVTAFCTLYYLEEAEMAAVLARARQLAPILILQSNDGTRLEAADNKAEKASTRFLRILMENSGYKDIQYFTKPAFSRNILVGKVSGWHAN